MKKAILSILVTCSLFIGSAQSKLELKKVSVQFPASYLSTKVQDIEVYNVSIDSVTFQVLISPKSSLTVKNESQFNSSVNATTNGFVQSLGTDFKREIKDSTIGTTKGKFVHVYEPTQPHKFKEGFSFVTIIEDQALFINSFIYGTIDDNISRKRIEDFFKSLKFEGKQF